MTHRISPLAFSLCLTAGAAFAQWRNAARLSDPAHTGDIKEARLAPAADGGFHAIYRHFAAGGVEVRYRRYEGGSLRPAVLVHQLGFLAGGEICESGDGGIHLVWENWDDVNEQIWWARSADGGLTFPSKQAITAYGNNPNGQAKNPMIVPFGSAGAEVLALSWGAPPANRMYHNRHNGTAWLGHTNSGISTSNSYAAWGSARNPVDGSVWRTYGKEVSGQWQIAIRRFNGTAWGPEEMVTTYAVDTVDEFPSRGNVAINSAGEVMVVWDAESDVWSRLRAANGTWGAVQRIGAGYAPAVTDVPGGRDFYLVHPWPRDSWNQIAGRRWSGGVWSASVKVSNGLANNYSPNCDITADPLGNLYACWEYWPNGGAGPPVSYFSVMPHVPPAALSAPLDGSGVLAPGTMTLTAEPGDATVTLTRVEFYQDGVKLGEKSAAPWTWPVSGLAAGHYFFHVAGTDSTGRRENSAAVSVVVVQGTSRALIGTGATWRYLDNGTDQGSAWRAGAFNDSAWRTGASQLGYGDGDETTTVEDNATAGYVAADTNRYITTYFRHTINIPGPGSLKALTGRLMRDDGAAVYLNGQEIHRSNLADAAAYNTQALATVNAPDESAWHTFVVPPSQLVAGANVIAVEVHQAAAGSSDLTFDFELTALQADPVPPAVSFLSPVNGAVLGAPASFPLHAGVSDDDGDVTKVEFFRNGMKLGEANGAPVTFTIAEAPAGSHVYTAIAHDAAGFTSPPAAVSVIVSATRPATLAAAGSAWRYLDTGSAAPAGWQQLNFNDATWKSGAAEFGFGDGGETTLIDGGPDGARYPTTYFRHRFRISQPAAVEQTFLRLLCDDGAVIYLNGQEIRRYNMPAGAVSFTTPALTAVGGADETSWLPFPFAASRLQPGENILAVEVHQSAVTSSDLSFDFSLGGYTFASLPQLAQRPGAAGIELSWPDWALAWRVEQSSDLQNWSPAAGTAVPDGTSLKLELPFPVPPAFFRLATP